MERVLYSVLTPPGSPRREELNQVIDLTSSSDDVTTSHQFIDLTLTESDCPSDTSEDTGGLYDMLVDNASVDNGSVNNAPVFNVLGPLDRELIRAHWERIRNESVDNASVDNASVDNGFVDDACVDDASVDDASVDDGCDHVVNNDHVLAMALDLAALRRSRRTGSKPERYDPSKN